MSAHLTHAGFTELDRAQRPAQGDHRPHLALAARAVGEG